MKEKILKKRREERERLLRAETKNRFLDYLNAILTILLVIAVMFAVQQRFFEEKKCVDWAKARVFEIEQGIEGVDFDCILECNSSVNDRFVAKDLQQKSEWEVNFNE